MPNYSGVWNLTQQLQAVAANNWPAPPPIALFGGGSTAPSSNIYYVLISTSGTPALFGELQARKEQLAACSSSTRGIWGGGLDASSNTQAALDYVTIASSGTSANFGSLTLARAYLSACSNSTRGVWGGG